MYADDTSIYFPFDSKNVRQNLRRLQSDLDNIWKWSNRWHLEFKASKSVDMTFHSVKKLVPLLPRFKMGSNVIPSKQFHKHLGLTLDENLNFIEHVSVLGKRFQKMVNPLRALNFKLPSRHIEKMYLTFILPILDHSDILYQSASVNSLAMLERTHYRAACAVSGVIHGSNTSKVLKNLNWETLVKRRRIHLNCYTFKAVKGLKPQYVLDILSDHKANNRPDINLRNRREYILPARISKRYKTSPALSLVANINSIFSEIQNHNSFQSFKRSQKSKLFPIKITTPTTHMKLPLKLAKLLNRMRVGLILKSHFFSHNFTNIQTPECPCGSRIQNEKHFFLDCTLLNNNRLDLLLDFESLNVDIYYRNLNKANKINFLLYGNPKFTVVTNDKIIKTTSEYISKSKHVFYFRNPN